MKRLFFPLAICIVAACGQNAQPSAENGDGPQSRGDSLLQEVIDAHDVAMPKMKQLERLINESKAALDSLNGLPPAAQKQHATLKTKLEQAHTGLSHANQSMNEWMAAFKYDSFKNDEAARIKYLEEQKSSALLMKDAVLNSIATADSVLGHQ